MQLGYLSTVVEILNTPNPSLARIKNELGAEQGLAVNRSILVTLMNEFLDFFNIGKNMSASQVTQTVDLLLENYIVLKPDHFALFFKRAKMGFYGQVYDRMDGQIIIQWFEKFMEQYYYDIEYQRNNENMQYKKHLAETKEGDIVMPEWFKIWVEDWKRKDNLTKVAENKPVLNQSEEQIYYSQLLREFDDLWRQQGSSSGLRLVKIGDRHYDSYEYLQYRLQNDKTT